MTDLILNIPDCKCPKGCKPAKLRIDMSVTKCTIDCGDCGEEILALDIPPKRPSKTAKEESEETMAITLAAARMQKEQIKKKHRRSP